MRSVLAIMATLSLLLSMSAQADQNQESAPVYRHLVMFKFKDGVKPDEVQKVIDAFADLPSKIDTIKGFEWGTNISPENKVQGFTHCFSVTFADKTGLEIYLPHPAHKAFGQIVGPVMDKVLVFDFIPEN